MKVWAKNTDAHHTLECIIHGKYRMCVCLVLLGLPPAFWEDECRDLDLDSCLYLPDPKAHLT